MQVRCDGFKTEINDEHINALMAIPVTQYDPDFWIKYHSLSMSFDMTMNDVYCTVNWDENSEFPETHQISNEGIHEFSIHRERWVNFIN
jgi:hypothetical protein